MSAFLRLPRSAHPDWLHDCRGYTSLEHLQKEMLQRHSRYRPPYFFDPKWGFEPTVCNTVEDGVELWKWSISQDKWALDAVITWRN